MDPIRCIVVDDAALMRATIRQMLDRSPGIEVIDTAGSGPVALEKIRDQKPDVVTLDVEMPGMDGIEVLRRIMAGRRPREARQFTGANNHLVG